MMKIKMKHQPGVTVLQNSEELFPTEEFGLSRMEGLRERDGDGMGMGTGTPFRDKPPRLSRKGGLRAGSS